MPGPPKTANLDYAKRILEKMVAESDNGLWTGNATELVGSIAPMPSYGKLMGMLKGVGAITQVKRGGGTSPSVWEILNPDPDWTAEVGKASGKITQLHTPAAVLTQRVDNLEKMVGGIDIPDALATLAREINAIKAQLVKGDESELSGATGASRSE